jgi:hypothetical protein
MINRIYINLKEGEDSCLCGVEIDKIREERKKLKNFKSTLGVVEKGTKKLRIYDKTNTQKKSLFFLQDNS